MTTATCCECQTPLIEPDDLESGICHSCYMDELGAMWTQCDDYYNCEGCCSAGRDLISI